MKISLLLWILVIFTLPVYAQKDCLDFHVIDSAPLGFLDENGEMQGVHVELLQYIAKQSGVCISLRLMPYARILRSLEEGTHDGGILFKYAQRANVVEFVAHIQDMQTVVVTNQQLQLSSFADLSSLVIGKTRGTDLSDEIALLENFQVVELTNYQQAAEMLHKGRIDAMAGSALVLFYQLSNLSSMAGKVNFSNKLVLGSRAQWLQISKRTKQVIDYVALKKATEKAVADPMYDKIMQKYYGLNWRQINQ